MNNSLWYLRATGRWLGLFVGLSVTAISMSSGFIWASKGEILLVYVTGFTSWTGYLFAHYASIGVFVDNVSGPSDGTNEQDAADGSGESANPPDKLGSSIRHPLRTMRGLLPGQPAHAVGFVVGIAVLVAGIAILAWYVRQEQHLLGNLGSGMFLAGYVIAHYFESGKPL